MSTSSDLVLRTLRRAKIIVYLVLIFVIGPMYLYFNLPVISPWFAGLPLEILFISLLITILEVRLVKKQKSGLFIGAAIVALISLIYIIFMSAAGMPIFRAQKYHKLLGEVKEGESFSEDIAPISTDKIRIVDQAVAYRLGDKVLGNDPALGSQVNVGEFRIQKVKDQLYWVAPLEHSGFFKWLSNREGTPGYIMVSATDSRDVKLVQKLDNGKEVKLKYQLGGFFGDYLPRHVYFQGYFHVGMTDYTFEIDDDGNPYWVITLFKHEIGFAGNDAYAIVVVDAATGESTKYTSETAPSWVDRIQPKEIIESQIQSWGEYVHGFWNFSNLDKLTSTEGMSLVYGDDNRSYWYTGITSVGSDESTIGFMLVDTRTKEAKLYRQPGATETAAMMSAQGKVQEKGYHSSFPIMYNINGIPTYVMSLKDRAGLIKMIALVSVVDYSIVGVGDDLKEALRSYKSAYKGSGNNTIIRDNKNSFRHKGKVLRIAEDIADGTSYYYLVVEGAEHKIFIGTSGVSRKLPLTEVGDSVQIIYDDGRLPEIEVMGFDNYLLDIKETQKPELMELNPSNEEPKSE
jgi:hypothetical protein